MGRVECYDSGFAIRFLAYSRCLRRVAEVRRPAFPLLRNTTPSRLSGMAFALAFQCLNGIVFLVFFAWPAITCSTHLPVKCPVPGSLSAEVRNVRRNAQNLSKQKCAQKYNQVWCGVAR
jgi:hypothetical protein